MSEDLKPIVPEQQEEALEQSVVNAEQVAKDTGDISKEEIVQPEKAVEEAPKAKAPKKAPKAKVAEETSEAAVAEDAPKAEAVEETPKLESFDENPVSKAAKKGAKAKHVE